MRKIRFTFTVVKTSGLKREYTYTKEVEERYKYSIAHMYERNFLEVLGYEVASVTIERL